MLKNSKNMVNLQSQFKFVFFLILLLFPSIAFSEVIAYDMIALKGEEIMLMAETKGKFFKKGGEIVEFFINGKSIGKSLSGGDGYAFKQFLPLKVGIYKITVKSGEERDNVLLLSLQKGARIVFIDVEGSLIKGVFSMKPKTGSQNIIKKISSQHPVIFLQTGLLGTHAIKNWLKENGFIDLPVMPWKEGLIFEEISEKGLKIKVVIGSSQVIESARAFKPKAFSFGEADDAEEVSDWGEIGKKMK
jgi:hypothetical protein